MKDMKELFEMALGLGTEWHVTDITLSPEEHRIDISLDFDRGTKFPCPKCDTPGCGVHDTLERTWRHLNFFEFETYLHARMPRVSCDRCGVHQVTVPWARPGSGFTLFFESLAMALMRMMPVEAAAKILNVWSTRLWRLLHRQIDGELASLDLSDVRYVGVDETSSRKGHNYITVFANLEQNRVIHVAEGRGIDTLESFRSHLEIHGGHADQMELFSCDMSTTFTAGILAHFPGAEIVYDRFHVVKLVQKALDQVRREERLRDPKLAQTKYIWLRNPENLSATQKVRLEELTRPAHHLQTARAWAIKESFRDIFRENDLACAHACFRHWYFWATHSRLAPMIRVAKGLKNHQDRILRSVETGVSNGILEGLNSLIQAAKAKARGFRTLKNLKAACYLVGGKFELGISHLWWMTHTRCY